MHGTDKVQKVNILSAMYYTHYYHKCTPVSFFRTQLIIFQRCLTYCGLTPFAMKYVTGVPRISVLNAFSYETEADPACSRACMIQFSPSHEHGKEYDGTTLHSLLLPPGTTKTPPGFKKYLNVLVTLLIGSKCRCTL